MDAVCHSTSIVHIDVLLNCCCRTGVKGSKGMSHDAAMRILGLKDGKSKNNKGVLVSKRLEDHTEEDILEAFQKESASYSKKLTSIQCYHNRYIGKRMLSLIIPLPMRNYANSEAEIFPTFPRKRNIFLK